MEKELIALREKLNALDDIVGDVWEQVYDWEKEFKNFVDKKRKVSYDWCEDELKKIHTDNKKKFPERFI